ncbi:hypothetical protein EVAR_98174_1 [Eumeta japonica]|uniref:Uncharacterized protein n=1 Tax=Eumeta variegata TaxID=151549 RepID=A0A4C1YK59_EUMVA|nr:hypothetical protein EVAR_98174_1 [Eumeta japonica]
MPYTSFHQFFRPDVRFAFFAPNRIRPDFSRPSVHINRYQSKAVADRPLISIPAARWRDRSGDLTNLVKFLERKPVSECNALCLTSERN